MNLFTQADAHQEEKSGAVLSDCGKYRYRLWRKWDTSKPLVLWVMHNPSKADATESDATIDKITRFTKSWGYGGFYVGNLSPYRATNPENLKGLQNHELFPSENYNHIMDMAFMCDLHVLAHGNPAWLKSGMKHDYKKLPKYSWHYLKLTNSGNPYHPLYLKSNLTPILL